MEIQMETHDHDETITIQLQGDLDYRGAGELQALFKTLTDKAIGQRIVLDLKEVPFIDSSGLAALVSIQRAMRQHNGELLLSGVSPQVRRLFQVTMLDRAFTFIDPAS